MRIKGKRTIAVAVALAMASQPVMAMAEETAEPTAVQVEESLETEVTAAQMVESAATEATAVQPEEVLEDEQLETESSSSHGEKIELNSTNFPDENFLASLKELDTDGDGSLVCKDITKLELNEESISSLKGIENFHNLETLFCEYNNISSLDLSQNKSLKKLYCSGNSLTSLDLSQNKSLVELYCPGNSLTSLDVSNHASLSHVVCSWNYLTELNISGCSKLDYLDCTCNYLDNGGLIMGDVNPTTLYSNYNLMKKNAMSDELADKAVEVTEGENSTKGVTGVEISEPVKAYRASQWAADSCFISDAEGTGEEYAGIEYDLYYTAERKLYKVTVPAFSTCELTFEDMNAGAEILEKWSEGTYETIFSHDEFESCWDDETGDWVTKCYAHTYENMSAQDKTFYLLVEESEDGTDTRFNVGFEELEKIGKDEVGILGDVEENLIPYIEEKYPEYKGRIKNYSMHTEDALAFSRLCEGTCILGAYAGSALDELYNSSDELANLEDIIDVEGYRDNAFAYTVNEGTYAGELKAITDKANPGCFEYNTRIAEEVLGTSDPDKVQAMLSTPEKFIEVAKKMKEAGYYMTSCAKVVLDGDAGNSSLVSYQAKTGRNLYTLLTEGGYDKAAANGYDTNSKKWLEDLRLDDVFGMFEFAGMGETFALFAVDSDGNTVTRNACKGPVAYHLGETYYAVKSGTTNEMARDILETMCCNEDDVYALNTYVDTNNYEVYNYFPNNKEVAQKKNDNGTTNSKENYYVVEPYPLWIDIAENLGAGADDEEETVAGDTNGDNNVNISDLMQVLNHVSGKSTLIGNAFTAGDVTGDGKVDLQDLMKILNFVSGKSKEL
jgi:hypothetical protein